MGSFKRVQTQFIAALGDPQASEGSQADQWGIWRIDPGPRGVRLNNFKQLEKSGGAAPAGWKWDPSDWWLEEHGLIMEKPDFPLPAGRYLVTGGREVTTILTVTSDSQWSLADGAKLYDVTHLPCRSARYKGGSPGNANPKEFPVTPGGMMPDVPGVAEKQDYWVVFVVGVEAGKAEL